MYKLLSLVTFTIFLTVVPGLQASEPDFTESGSLSPEQMAAMDDMQAVGGAFMDWLNDRNLGLSDMFFARWSGVFRVEDLSNVLFADELEAALVPDYIDEVPVDDPWGRQYEYRISGNPRIWPAFAVRSAGRDLTFQGDEYGRGTYPAAEADNDIVWVQDGFAYWPD